MLGYIIIALFCLISLLVYLEKYIGKYKLAIYIAVGIILILLAGTREVGIDPDSENYEKMYHNLNSDKMMDAVEYSYILFSQILQYISNDVHAIFLFYALLGLSFKFIAFRELSEFWFLPVLLYISYFYELHEAMEIRTGVLSGLFLLSIKPICEGRRLYAFILLAIGVFFHYSEFVLFPLLFLSNKSMSVVQRIIWASVIPLGYLFYFVGFSAIMSFSTEIPYIGNKLALYQAGTEKGILQASVNVFSPLYLFTITLFYYLLFFYETIIQFNKYFPLLIKIFALSLCAYTSLAILPVLAQRISLLLQIVNIILYTNIC